MVFSYAQPKTIPGILQRSASFPLHTHLLFPPSATILSLSLTDPASALPPPPTTNTLVPCRVSKGVTSFPPRDFHHVALALQPDIIWALSDLHSGLEPPSGTGKNSQGKKERRGVERTVRWLNELVETKQASPDPARSSIWVELMGGVDQRSRKAFVEGLVGEPPFPSTVSSPLDDSVAGYVLPLSMLRQRLHPSQPTTRSVLGVIHHPSPTEGFVSELEPLLEASFGPLPVGKPRYAPGALSPHEILALVEHGLDLFDYTLADEAAEAGVGLTFEFPVLEGEGEGRVEIGENLYEGRFELDFRPLADQAGRVSIVSHPTFAKNPLKHCPLSEIVVEDSVEPPFSKAYVHHLLMTHE